MNSCQCYVYELWSDIYVALIREEIVFFFFPFGAPRPPPPPPPFSLSLEYRRIPVDVMGLHYFLLISI